MNTQPKIKIKSIKYNVIAKKDISFNQNYTSNQSESKNTGSVEEQLPSKKMTTPGDSSKREHPKFGQGEDFDDLDIELLDVVDQTALQKVDNYFDDSDEDDEIDFDQSPLLIRLGQISENEIQEIMQDIKNDDGNNNLEFQRGNTDGDFQRGFTDDFFL